MLFVHHLYHPTVREHTSQGLAKHSVVLCQKILNRTLLDGVVPLLGLDAGFAEREVQELVPV